MPKQTPSNPITDAIVDLHFAPCFAAMDSPYSYVKSFAEKHSKKERWGWVYYSAAKERYEARYGKINEKIDEHIESISNAIKSSLLSRYEHVAQLEQEIKEIQAILDAGYIAKVITINGAKHEKIEILATKEIKQLEDLKDRKRSEIFKVLGYYEKQTVHIETGAEILTAKGLTDAEKSKMIEKILSRD